MNVHRPRKSSASSHQYFCPYQNEENVMILKNNQVSKGNQRKASVYQAKRDKVEMSANLIFNNVRPCFSRILENFFFNLLTHDQIPF